MDYNITKDFIRRLCCKVTLFICLLINSQLRAQSNFPQDSAMWKVWHKYISVPYSTYLITHQLVGDTVLLGDTYQKIHPGFYLVDSYIREIDSTKQVYYLADKFDTVQNRVLYDFSKSIGDTIKVIDQWNQQANWIVLADGIDSTGQNLRRYLDVQLDGLNYVDRWIEGIGSIHGLFAPIDEPSGFFEHYFELICFHDEISGTQYAPDSLYDCNTPNYVFDIDDYMPDFPQIKVYPNPAAEIIAIECDCSENFDYELLDATGRIVSLGKLSKMSSSYLNIANLEHGIYLMNFHSTCCMRTIKVIIL